MKRENIPMPRENVLQSIGYGPYQAPIYSELKRMIIGGELKPGAKLVENTLAEIFGVSRTPIREAIRRLAADGLVKISPKKGAHVSVFLKTDVDELYEIRHALEPLALRKAAENLKASELKKLKRILNESAKAFERGDIREMTLKNTEFHDVIHNGTKNQRLHTLLTSLSVVSAAHRGAILKLPGAAEESLRVNGDILASLLAKDPAALDEAIHRYLSRGKELLLQSIERRPRDGSSAKQVEGAKLALRRKGDGERGDEMSPLT